MTDDLDAKLRRLEAQRQEISRQLAETSSVLSDMEERLKKKAKNSGGHDIGERKAENLTPSDSIPVFDESAHSEGRTTDDTSSLRLVPNKLTNEQITVRPGDIIHSAHLIGNENMEESRAAICVKDAQGIYLYANKAVHEFFNASPGTIIGTTDSVWLPPEHAQTLRENDLKATADDTVLEALENVVSPAAGVATSWYSFKFPIAVPEETLIGIIAFEVTNLVASTGLDKAREVARARFSKLSELREQLVTMSRQLRS